jgi:hypothetical protein
MAKNQKTHAEKLVESVLAHAKTLKKVTEDSIRKDLSESFSPQIKKAISQHLAEMEDFDMEDDEEILDENEDYEEDFVTDDELLEDEDVEETPVDMDVDMESDEDFATDDVVADVEMDMEDVEELEETSGGSEADDFMKELQSLLEEDEMEDYEEDEFDELNEDTHTDEFDQEHSELKEMHTEEFDQEHSALNERKGRKMRESKDGGAYNGKETDKNHAYAQGNESKKNHAYEMKVENQKLKESLNKMRRQFEALALDVLRKDEFKAIVSRYPQLNESAKLKVASTLDTGKNERQIKAISETLNKTFQSVYGSNRKPSVKTESVSTKRRNVAGKSSSIRPMKKSAKSLQERTNKGGQIITEGLANRWAQLAGIDSED